MMGDQLIILILLVSLLIVLGEEGEGGEVQVDEKNRSGILYAAAQFSGGRQWRGRCEL